MNGDNLAKIKKLVRKPMFLAGVAGLALVGVTTVWVLKSPPVHHSDAGLGGNADVPIPPEMRKDHMSPVGDAEADRRVTQNVDAAQRAMADGKSYVAPPVIAKSAPAKVEAKEVKPEKELLPSVVGVKDGEEEEVTPDRGATHARSHDSDEQEDDGGDIQTIGSRLNEQVDALVTSVGGGISRVVVADYRNIPSKGSSGNGKASGKAGDASASRGNVHDERPASASDAQKDEIDPSKYDIVLAAKPGDLFYGTLKVGFNSDDPQGLPIFATIHDQRPDGSYGPLDGAVLEGSVDYTDRQAAVTFTRMILPDGRDAATQAMAVRLGSLRPGIAEKVNNHNFARFGAMTVASLLEGLGYAGEMFVSNSRSMVANNSGIYGMGTSGVDWGQAGLAAAEPLGSNLNSALTQDFYRQSTKSSKAGMEIGIVALQTIEIPELKKDQGMMQASANGASSPGPMGVYQRSAD